MKIPMIKMKPGRAVKSKGMLAGLFMMGLGTYVMVIEKEFIMGQALLYVGLGITGIRDANED
jgi:hypothetical protein